MTNIVILAVIVLLGINLSVGNVTEEDGAQVIFRLTVDATNQANKKIALEAEKLNSLPSKMSPQLEQFAKGVTENIIAKSSFDLQSVHDKVFDYSRELKRCTTEKCRALIMVKFTHETMTVSTKIETIEKEAFANFQQARNDILQNANS